MSRAKRTMAQIANATRSGCDSGAEDCNAAFPSRRPAGDLSLPEWMEPLRGLLDAAPKWGTSRLLTHGLGRGIDEEEGGNYLREPVDTPGAGMAMLAQGDVLGADDVYALNLGPPQLAGLRNPLSCSADDSAEHCWGDPRFGRRADRPYRFLLETSVWATSDEEPDIDRGGVHWRIAHLGGPIVRGWRPPTARGGLGTLGLNEVHKTIAPGVRVTAFVANVRPLMDGNHRWPGLAPFMHFEPGQFALACDASGTRNGAPHLSRAAGRAAGFNQPSAWVVLGRGLREGPWRLNPAGRLELRSSGLEFRVPQEGQFAGTVVARAQAYYHRPGNWAEPPNFFNPYWRARLASVWQGRGEVPLVQDLVEALPEPLRRHPQKALVH